MEVKAEECIQQVLRLTLVDATLGVLDLGLSPHLCSDLLKHDHDDDDADCITHSTGNQSFPFFSFFFFFLRSSY